MSLRSFALFAPALLAPVCLAQQATDWQQEVAYEIDFTLLADRNQFRGTQRLIYTNNSPDTLQTVFYHLYFNAFHPQSLMAERNRHLPDPDPRIVPRIFELGPDEVGYQRVLRLEQDGRPVEWDVHDTVMRVALARPIYPGEAAVFEMVFEGQVPLQTRRSGRDNREGVRFSMAQWYPKVAHYDAIGWHPHPYIGREFYAPFGTFDVRLTLPSEYVVGATGTLQNPELVGHGYEQRPDGGRVATGPARLPDGTVPDSLTWHFRAERVHDFAWAADPEFIHERHLVRDVPGRDDPVHVHLLYKHEVAQAWRHMGSWVADMTRFFSARFGPYPYPQFTVAQGGDGGMEYPMLTLITGHRTAGSLFSVTAHEYAHMWFYGVVASNESLFSWIDEGFTNFATTEAIHHLFHRRDGPADHSAAIRSIVEAQLTGVYERPNKAADWYDTNSGFGVAAYTAGQAFVELLGYVVGDEVRDRFLRRFATEWRWRHPYPADILQTAQKESGMQLYWLFEQFLTGAERYDYAATGLRTEATGSGVRSTIDLQRRESGVLPVDLWLRFADGSARWVHIPVDVAFGHKAVPAGWSVAAPWPWVHPTYQLDLVAAHPVVEAIVDPLHRTPDVDRSNNRVARGPDVPLAFDGFFRLPRTYSDARSITLSPVGLYSNRYGLGAGAQARMRAPLARSELQLALVLWPQALTDTRRGAMHIPLGRFEPRALSTAWHDGIDYTLRWRRQAGRFASLHLDSRKFIGLMESRLGARMQLGGREPRESAFGEVAVGFAHQHRTTDRAFAAVPPASRSLANDHGALFGRDHLLAARLDLHLANETFTLGAVAEVGGALRNPGGAECEPVEYCSASGPPRSANRVFFTGQALLPIGAAAVRGRAAAGLGAEHLAPQKLFRLGAASVETRWREPSYSVPAAAFEDPGGQARFMALSGVGPVGYLLAPGAPVGNALVAGGVALELGPLRFPEADAEVLALLDPLIFELFAGVGAAWHTATGLDRADWLADAGLGMRYDLGQLVLLRQQIQQSEVLRGMNLVARFPLWLSDPSHAQSEKSFEFRWVIGIETGI